MGTQQTQISFAGPDLANVVGQAEDFIKKFSGTTKVLTTANRVGKTAAAKAAKETTVEDEDESSLSASDDSDDPSIGDDTEDTESLGGDEDESEESFSDLADEPSNKKVAAKTAKPAKITLKDVNKCLVTYTKEVSQSREKTQKLLEKNFKVKSVNELKETQYAKILEVFKVK